MGISVRGPFLKAQGGGAILPSNYPTKLSTHLELYLDSRQFNGLVQDYRIGDLNDAPSIWLDQSGQTQGPSRSGITDPAFTPARCCWLQVTSAQRAPNGAPSVKFISQTSTPINPNPINRLLSIYPKGVDRPWNITARGHTFIFGGRFYDMGTESCLWTDLVLDNRCQLTLRSPNVPLNAPALRTNAGTFFSLNTTGTIFNTSPLPWGLLVLRLRPPVAPTTGTVDFFRISESEGRTDYAVDANASWNTGNAEGWLLSGNINSNIAQNMDLGFMLWYSTALSDNQIQLLSVWNELYFGSEL